MDDVNQPSDETIGSEAAQEQRAYRKAVFPDLKLGTAWGEPISSMRAADLDRMLHAWKQEAEHGERKGPFEGVALTGADVFWLAARTLAGVDWAQAVTRQKERLRQARLQEEREESPARLYLSALNLTGATLSDANLTDAYLPGANLTGAFLRNANLTGANLLAANLTGAFLRNANLSSADLTLVRMSVETDLTDTIFTHTTRLADVIWNGVPLARTGWKTLPVVGDETHAEYEEAVRAYRLLAVTLRSQGLNEHADRYAYRAQLMQRVVLRRQKKISAYVFSLFLAVLTGYGYRLWRILAAYVLVVALFAGLFWLAGFSAHGTVYRFDVAAQISLNAIHGRVFFAPQSQFGLDTVQSWIATAESIVGIVIEGLFVAVLIQRLFSR